jgi:hypothetical protein
MSVDGAEGESAMRIQTGAIDPNQTFDIELKGT